MSTLCPPPQATGAFFPGVVTRHFVASCEFYYEHFGFQPIVVEEDHIVLARPDGARLALLRAGHPAQPAALQQATRGTGIWLHLEVDDPDALHARLAAAGVEIVAPPEFTLAATRRFIVRDPNGVLLHVSDHLAPAAQTSAAATSPEICKEASS